MQKFSGYCHGIQGLSFFLRFRHFLLYSTSTAAETNPAFVNYLVESQGFSKKQALSTSTKLAHLRQTRGAKKVSDFNFIENADSVIAFLKQVGLEQSHIRKTLVSAPNLLLCNVDKTLKPKTEIFLKLGFSESDVAEFMRVNPSIFLVGKETTIAPAFQYLRETFGPDFAISILKKTFVINRIRISEGLVPNVALLRDYGVPLDSIARHLLINTYWLFRKSEDFRDVVINVEEELRIPRNAPQFLTCIRLLNKFRVETIESKKQVFKSFGWTESDVLALLRSCPTCLCLSEATIKEKLCFLMNELGYEPSYLASKKALLTCSLQKRIVPRHEFLRILKEKGLINTNYSFYFFVCLGESRFLKRFVLPFEEVHQVYAKHAGISLEKLTLQLSKLNSNVA